MKHVNLDNPECPGDKMTSPPPDGNGGIKTTPKGNGAIFTVNIVLLVLAMSSNLFF
jgi:hypothetical protein